MTGKKSERTLQAGLQRDLGRKLVVLTGARQAGKTTLARQLMAGFEAAQVLSWDVPADRRLIAAHAWTPKARLVVFDEIHKMRGWKTFLKGAWDGRSDGQAMLVTGSARMDTFRQGGESLAGRYFGWRLHPFSVRELMQAQGLAAAPALQRLLQRGGFPEPCLGETDADADRWRAQYVTDLVREDVLDFSRVHEVRTLQLLLQMLRERVGSPVKLSSLAQALQISPTTAARYVEILEALYIVFRVTPWHRDVARSLLKEPKIYFLDNGLVQGDAGARLENAVAAMLLKHCHYRQDAEGKPVTLHTIRDKERHEIDFVLAEGDTVTDLIEVKLTDAVPSAFLHRMAERFAPARALHLVAELRQPAQHGRVEVARLDEWLAALAA
jgi:predicted AAA+ superfamily ATPase